MRIAVLASPRSWYAADLRRAAGDRHEVVTLPFTSLGAAVVSGRRVARAGGVDLLGFDALVVRTMPPGSLEQVVFRMDALAGLEAAGVVVVNPARAVEAAVDKHLATARLADAGLDTPDTFTCQTRGDALAAFDALGGDVVLKPLFGGEGRGVTRLADRALAERAFALVEGLGGVLYLQRFVPHAGHDLRLLVVGDEVLGMRRVNPTDWRTNISLGARAEPLGLTPELARLARRGAGAVGALVAGVDLLPGLDGRTYAIEVNAVPGWRALAGVTGRDVAALVVRLIEGLVERSARPGS